VIITTTPPVGHGLVEPAVHWRGASVDEGHHMAHAKLTGHHLVTAEKILNHPASHNIEWHDAAALLAEIGSITEGSNHRFTVTLGDETEVFDRPRGKDLDTQQIVDLRRMLRASGFTLESIHE
jgi:hypothetical protein